MEQMDQKLINVLAQDCRGLIAGGGTQEDVIKLLRHRGCSKIQSIRVLMTIYQVEIPEAKSLVDLSPTWADRRDDDDRFHRTLDKVQG